MFLSYGLFLLFADDDYNRRGNYNGSNYANYRSGGQSALGLGRRGLGGNGFFERPSFRKGSEVCFFDGCFPDMFL